MRIFQLICSALRSSLRLCRCRVWGWVSLTLDGSQDDAGVVVGDDVGVTIFGLVHLQVGVFPGELLAWIDRLTGGRDRQNMHTQRRNQRSLERSWAITIRPECYHRKKRWGWRGREIERVISPKEKEHGIMENLLTAWFKYSQQLHTVLYLDH